MSTSPDLLIKGAAIAKLIEEVEIVHCLEYLNELHDIR